jgi:hypothetical protein
MISYNRSLMLIIKRMLKVRVKRYGLELLKEAARDSERYIL